MTRKDFKTAAAKQNIIIYKIRTEREKGNKGIFIDFAHDYGSGTVSTKKTDGDWNMDEDEVFAKFLTTHWARKTGEKAPY